MLDMKPWEIWYARVKFEDTDEIKSRPVVVLETGEVAVIALKVTGHEERNYYGDIDITYWQSAGLTKPSTIRAGIKLVLDYSAFERKVGVLQYIDRINVLKALPEY